MNQDEYAPLVLNETRTSPRKTKGLKMAVVFLSILLLVSVGLLVWFGLSNQDLKKDKGKDKPLPYNYAWLPEDISSRMDTSANPCEGNVALSFITFINQGHT